MGERRGASARRSVLAVLAGLALATLLGLVVLWPRGGGPELPAGPQAGAREAEVVSASTRDCPPELPVCRRVQIEVLEGPQRGRPGAITLPADDTTPELSAGDHIRVLPTRDPSVRLPPGTPPPQGATAADTHIFVEFERRLPLLSLAVLFAALAVLFGRRRGALSLIGLAASLVVVTQFVVPAILDGKPPLLVALVGALAVMLTTTAITHGVGPKSSAAMLGSAATLLLTALLAVVFVDLAHITGFFSGEATLLSYRTSGELSPSGLVLAGIVIAALGVLDDVTVSQASTVMALRRADPSQSFRRLYDGAIGVGRDHLGATVNTLVLAYVGASLPVLLIFETQQTSFAGAVNREPVAEPIVATLVGSIGLIAAVPLTTALAALLAVRLPREAIPADAHAHHH